MLQSRAVFKFSAGMIGLLVLALPGCQTDDHQDQSDELRFGPTTSSYGEMRSGESKSADTFTFEDDSGGHRVVGTELVGGPSAISPRATFPGSDLVEPGPVRIKGSPGTVRAFMAPPTIVPSNAELEGDFLRVTIFPKGDIGDLREWDENLPADPRNPASTSNVVFWFKSDVSEPELVTSALCEQLNSGESATVVFDGRLVSSLKSGQSVKVRTQVWQDLGGKNYHLFEQERTFVLP